MSALQITDLSLSTLQQLYKSGTTPVEVISAIYDRLEAQPLHPVWITLVPRHEALACAEGLGKVPNLPLFGIPFAAKDNIDVADYETTAACPAFAFTPKTSAFVVEQLLQAGAILIGKTNLDQFATGLVGTRSPHGACSSVFDERYISGGSSSGSAVAVASGLVSFSLGTDTAGSGRVPAGFNNIVGLKPSRGLISARGVVPACRSLDCVSIFALSCHDAEIIFEAAKAFDIHDPFAREWPDVQHPLPKARLRIGVPRLDQRQFFGDSDYQQLYRDTLTMLGTDEHHIICEIDFEPFRAAAELLYAGPYVAERFAAVGDFVKAHTIDVDPIVGSIVLGAEHWTASDAYLALYKLHALKKQTEQIWKDIDVLLLPTNPTTYTIEQVQNDPINLNSQLGYYTNFVNLLDLCGVAVPAGFTIQGLPFGVTVIGRTFQDLELLAFAQIIQRRSSPIAGNYLSPVPEYSGSASNKGWIELGVIGAHLSGQPLNHQLTDRGALLLRQTRTASDYRLYALIETTPQKPGLVRENGFAGPGIEIEIWNIHESQFGSFVAGVPAPLSIGTCRLADGSSVKGFLCEPYGTIGMPEITHMGGWRAFLSS